MQKITPFLWFEKDVEKAAEFYVSLFENSKIGDISHYPEATVEVSGQKKGSVMTVEFELSGQKLIGLNGGPIFKFTPAISFFVSCKTVEEIDRIWTKLSEGGKVLMEFGKYPFAEKYGWLQDKFDLSWQLMLSDKPQKITPTLMFVGKVAGKAKEAIKFYTSLFSGFASGEKDSKIINMIHYEKGEGDKEENIKHAEFTLSGQEFIAMDSSLPHPFTFTEAISLMVNCESQEEIDYFWEKLSAVPEAEQCGWLKDKYGVSWQIVPTVLSKLLSDKDQKKVERVTAAFLKMKKFDIAKLKEAYEGK